MDPSADPDDSLAALEPTELRLSNGLTLLLRPDPAAQLFTLMLWVPAGSRTERPGITGISHYLEHCYSLGSRRYGPREIDRFVSAVGGRKNAFTSHDCTAYYASCPPEALETLVRMEADRFAHLALPPERLASELRVVQEERRLRVDNAPAGRLRERLLELAYTVHPYGYPVIGRPADLERLDRDSVQRYYRTHYVPCNVTFALVGAFDSERVHALFETQFGSIPSGERPAPLTPDEPEQHEERRDTLVKESERLPRLAMLYKCPGLDDEDAIALRVLEGVLLHGETARLDRRLRLEGQLATYVAGGYWAMRDPCPFVIEAQAQRGVSIERLEDEITAAIDDVVEHGVEEHEVRRVCTRIELGLLSGLESTLARARALGYYETVSVRRWRKLAAILAALRRVEAAELRRVAARYLVRSRRTVCHQLPPPQTHHVPQRGSVSAPPPAPKAPRPETVPWGAGVQRIALPNGLTLLHEPCPGPPTVTIGLAIRGPAAIDPPRLAGLSALVADTLKAGTETDDEQALLARIADLGTSVRIERQPDWVQLATVVRRADLGAALRLLADLVTRPRLAQDKVERSRAALIAARASARARPTERLVEAFYRVLYGEHPYGALPGGSLSSLARITAADARRFVAERYRPEHTVLVVSGAYDPDELVETVAERFGAWRAADAPATVTAAAVPAGRRGVCLVDKPDQSQTYLRLGLVALARNHPDWEVLALGNHVLGGGGLSTRIPARVRTTAGLAYSARSVLLSRRLPAPWYVGLETRNASAAQAVSLVLEEIDRARTDGVSASELERARAQLAALLRFRQETRAGRAATLLESFLLELGPDALTARIERAARIEPAEVRAALARHLDPDRMTLVAIAPRAATAESLAGFGPPIAYTETE